MPNKQNSRFFLLILSALSTVYGLMGLQGSWVSFLFGITLLFVWLTSTSFYQGVMWGGILFSIHLSWVLVLFAKHQAWGIGIIVWFLLVSWYALWSGIWFVFFNKNRMVSTLFFFIFVTQISLWLFTGRFEGYPLCNPILGFLNKPEKKSCDLLQSGKIVWDKSFKPSFIAYRMVDWLHNHKKEQTKIMVFPESTFCFDIDHFECFFPIWTEGFDDCLILFGTHKKEWNVVYGLCKGQCVFWYKKQHLMPFVEYIPRILDCIGCSRIFLQDHFPDLSGGEQDLIEHKGMIFQIFICSEFFFQAKKVKGYPILLLYNESWFEWEWMKNLTERFVTLFSFLYQVPVYYTSTQGRSNFL